MAGSWGCQLLWRAAAEFCGMVCGGFGVILFSQCTPLARCCFPEHHFVCFSFASQSPDLAVFRHVLMFGLIDLTHGYYIAAGVAVLAALIPLIILPLPTASGMAVAVAQEIG